MILCSISPAGSKRGEKCFSGQGDQENMTFHVKAERMENLCTAACKVAPPFKA